MMKYFLIFIIAIFIFGKNQAQGIYDVAKISDELKKDAAVVVRNEEQFFDVKTFGSAH